MGIFEKIKQMALNSLVGDSFGVSGIVTVKRYKKGTAEAVRAILMCSKEVTKEMRAEINRILEKNLLGVATVQKNLVVTSSNHGRNLIAQRLAGTNTYTLNITHGEIGTGQTAPTNTDTALETPVERNAVTLASESNNVVSVRFFFSDAELANGTYYEFGTFVDGSAGTGTGQLFNRALFSSPYVKATGEDTTVEVEFTIN